MKQSEILKEAKKYLWNGTSKRTDSQSRFICIAIKDAFGDKYGNTKYGITSLIKRRMKGISIIEEWLWNQKIDPYKIDSKYLQDYRRRWMNELIKEYERKGK